MKEVESIKRRIVLIALAAALLCSCSPPTPHRMNEGEPLRLAQEIQDVPMPLGISATTTDEAAPEIGPEDALPSYVDDWHNVGESVYSDTAEGIVYRFLSLVSRGDIGGAFACISVPAGVYLVPEDLLNWIAGDELNGLLGQPFAFMVITADNSTVQCAIKLVSGKVVEPAIRVVGNGDTGYQISGSGSFDVRTQEVKPRRETKSFINRKEEDHFTSAPKIRGLRGLNWMVEYKKPLPRECGRGVLFVCELRGLTLRFAQRSGNLCSFCCAEPSFVFAP